MEKKKNYEELTIRDHFMFGKIYNAEMQNFNTTADLSGLPQSTQNMLSYINTGNAVDEATEKIDIAVKSARAKEEWRREYMLTIVHDIDMKREGREEGRIISLLDLVKDGILPIDVAANRAGMTVEEFEKAMKQGF